MPTVFSKKQKTKNEIRHFVFDSKIHKTSRVGNAWLEKETRVKLTDGLENSARRRANVRGKS